MAIVDIADIVEMNGHSPVERLRVSTADMPKQDCARVWQEAHGGNVFNIAIEPAPETRFHVDTDCLTLNGYAVSVTKMAEGNSFAPADYMSNVQETLTVFIPLRGCLSLQQRGRDTIIEAGLAGFLLNNETGSVRMLESGSVLTLHLPIPAVASKVSDISRLVARPIGHDPVTMKLLVGYATALRSLKQPIAAGLADIAVGHLSDLLANVLRSVEQPARPGREGIRIARRTAIKAEIAANLTKSDLSCEDVADRLGISPRYLRQLLQEEGTTFVDLVRYLRLQRAYRLLADPRQLTRPIGAIAYDTGFNDLSNFNRCFRRQFNATPSDIRADALRKTGQTKTTVYQ